MSIREHMAFRKVGKKMAWHVKGGLAGAMVSVVMMFLSPLMGKAPWLQKVLLYPYFQTIIARCSVENIERFPDATPCLSSEIELYAILALLVSYYVLGVVVALLIKLYKEKKLFVSLKE